MLRDGSGVGNKLRAVLSSNIKRYRNRRGWAQEKLAEKANISTNFLSGIETGKQWPYPETLMNLGRALDIEVYELFKPEEAVPSDIGAILTRYTEEASLKLTQMVSASLESLRKDYLTEDDS
jgi:transcriptional regulator with XRE-family HTH domain